jgi:hypothetical protein
MQLPGADADGCAIRGLHSPTNGLPHLHGGNNGRLRILMR